MKLVSNFNDRFKEAFENRSITEFASEIGVSKQSISAYINGTRKPKPIVSAEIAKKLNVSPAWLLGYDVPKAICTSNGDSGQIQRNAEFVELFDKLTPEQKDIIIRRIKKYINS